LSKELNDRVLTCVRAWGVTIERTAATRTSLLVHGKRAGKPVVLKVVKQEGDEWRCGEIAAKFGGRGVVQVYEHMPGAALFEKLDPGEPLAALTLAGRDEEAMDVLAMLLGRMAPGDPPEGCPTVEQWAGAFVRHAGSGDERVPASLVEPAQRIYSTSARRSAIPRCCTATCTTITCCRIASVAGAQSMSKRRRRARDELGAALRNPIDRPDLFATLDVVERRLDHFGLALGLDVGRRAAGASAQAVLSAI
jgi:hypothetical protein